MSAGSSNHRVVRGGRKPITVADIEEKHGMNCKDAAAELNVSPVTFWRMRRKLEMKRWPYTRCHASTGERIHNNNVPNSITYSGLSPNQDSIMVQGSSSGRRLLLDSQRGTFDHNENQQVTSDIAVDLCCLPANLEELSSWLLSQDTNMEAQYFVESISTDDEPLNSFSSIEDQKALFNFLIMLPLEDFANPAVESSMKNVLSILKYHPSLFSQEQAEQIRDLSVNFPILVRSWKEYYSQLQTYNLKSLDEREKIRDLMETSRKDEESLKVRYEELENKEKELMTQLVAAQKEKAGIAEQRTEKSKLISLAEEKEGHQKIDESTMEKTIGNLDNISCEWANLRSLFI